jgi:hypothetical protein
MIEEKTKVPNPIRYEIVDVAGNIFGDFDSAQAAADFAHKRWPGQEQDPDRTGKGWDIQVVGS